MKLLNTIQMSTKFGRISAQFKLKDQQRNLEYYKSTINKGVAGFFYLCYIYLPKILWSNCGHAYFALCSPKNQIIRHFSALCQLVYINLWNRILYSLSPYSSNVSLGRSTLSLQYTHVLLSSTWKLSNNPVSVFNTEKSGRSRISSFTS